jgi:hypothetical protein
MSTIGDVLGAVRVLIDDIDAVLKTDTATQAPEIAKTLNVQDQLKQSVTKVEDVLTKLEDGLEPVRRTAVLADALVGIFGIAPPFISALGDAARDTGGYLKALNIGLDGAVGVTADIDGALKTVAQALDVVEDTAEDLLAFVDPTQFTGIMASLKTLGKDLETLRQDPPDKPSGPGGGLFG